MTFASDEVWVDFHSLLSVDEQIAWKAMEEIFAAVNQKIEIQSVTKDYVTEKSNVLARIYK